MLRWQGSIQANPHPRQASADIPINPDQFTDVIPELPQSVWREKASKIGGALYCVYLFEVALEAEWLRGLDLRRQYHELRESATIYPNF